MVYVHIPAVTIAEKTSSLDNRAGVNLTRLAKSGLPRAGKKPQSKRKFSEKSTTKKIKKLVEGALLRIHHDHVQVSPLHCLVMVFQPMSRICSLLQCIKMGLTILTLWIGFLLLVITPW